MVICKSCYYNFGGVCANHCYFETFLPLSDGEFYVLDDFDPYGEPCAELSRRLHCVCSGFRPQPSFLCEQ